MCQRAGMGPKCNKCDADLRLVSTWQPVIEIDQAPPVGGLRYDARVTHCMACGQVYAVTDLGGREADSEKPARGARA